MDPLCAWVLPRSSNASALAQLPGCVTAQVEAAAASPELLADIDALGLLRKRLCQQFSFGRRALLEEAAGGQEFGVEQGCACGAADEIVREQRQLDVEQRAFADAAYDRGHAIARVHVAARLRAALVVEYLNWMAQSGW
jgi:hypothetical protein